MEEPRLHRQMLLVGAVVLGVAALTPHVRAQATVGGIVRDTNNLVLPGVIVVFISNDAGHTTMTTVSDERGHYLFTGLPRRTGTLLFRLSGFETVEREVNVLASPTIPDVQMPFTGLSRINGDVGPDDITRREYSFSVPLAFRWLWDPGWINASGPASLPFDTISVESFSCLGTCPAYVLRLRREGRAELNAVAHLRREGRFVGDVDVRVFGRLCFLLQRMGFQSLARRYVTNITDTGGFEVAASTGSLNWRVIDQGGSGPIELWAFEQTVGTVIEEIAWRPR